MRVRLAGAVSTGAGAEMVSIHLLAAIVLCYAWRVAAECEVSAHTEAGWVCGACAPGGDYASFYAVPYAKQPLHELRFQELQPPEPWEGCRDATKLGPICPQRDLFYRGLMRDAEMREDCIHANVYVPLSAARNGTLLPVYVFIHGGGFGFGSGDPDLNGPEYLVRDNVIVVTFNYRLGPFGFLSLNSSSVPGNAGLRDMVTLLRWVRRNVEAFGGDPDDVTIAGQSAGASAVHLLTLSKAAEGLFRRAITMSGSSIRSFFTTSPAYAQMMAQQFLTVLGINGTDPEETHNLLVATPLRRIIAAHNYLQDVNGLIVFSPVVESPHYGVETIIDNDPEILQAQGRGKNIPFIIGFTNAETEDFRPRFEEIDMTRRIQQMPLLLLPPDLIYKTPQEELGNKIAQITQEYFTQGRTLDEFIKLSTDSYFIYPALKLAEMRAARGGAPVYLYQFAYEAEYNVFEEVLHLRYQGAAHAEDLTFVLRPNRGLSDRWQSLNDCKMTNFMTTIVTNFMRYSDPTNGAGGWAPVERQRLRYLTIDSPQLGDEKISRRHMETLKFFDNLYS